jgi:hypothetical protein
MAGVAAAWQRWTIEPIRGNEAFPINQGASGLAGIAQKEARR